MAVITQRLAKENKRQPKLQVLIYPWMQQFDFSLPSHQYYTKNKMFSFSGCTLIKLVLWYLGEMDVSKAMENSLSTNEHVLLIENQEVRKAYAECLDIDLIPEVYKSGKPYYNNCKKLKDCPLFNGKLSDKSVLIKDKRFANSVKKLFNDDVSPGLASDDLLKKLPKAYVIVCELDELKDENLIYAARLQKNGVETDIAFYEDAYHGVIGSISKEMYNTIAVKMVDDLVNYIQKNI